jgi:predicted tellurium resistance membrane protein TerC
MSFDTVATLLNDPAAWAALLTLIALEVILGIDNLLFVTIITNRLPEERRERARQIGIGMALFLRLALLFTVSAIAGMTAPVIGFLGQEFSWRDIILIVGGFFLIWKATKEIHHSIDPDPNSGIFDSARATMTFGAAIAQILLIDVVFSVDSILTAIGMTDQFPIMVAAVVVTVLVMLVAATPLANFINAHPTFVMLALGFLLMIGMVLIAEGFGTHIPKGYIYAALTFALMIEALNMASRRAKPGDEG